MHFGITMLQIVTACQKGHVASLEFLLVLFYVVFVNSATSLSRKIWAHFLQVCLE